MRELVERGVAEELPNGYASKNIAVAIVLAIVLHIVFIGVFALIGSHAPVDEKNKVAADKTKPAAEASKPGQTPSELAPKNDRPGDASAAGAPKPPPTQVDTAKPEEIPTNPELGL